MNYLKKHLYFFLLLIILNSCGDSFDNFKKTMSGQKQVNSDEFLIKKKDPLVLPPQYEKLPLPNSGRKKQGESSVESAISSADKISGGSPKTDSALENMILKELRK